MALSIAILGWGLGAAISPVWYAWHGQGVGGEIAMLIDPRLGAAAWAAGGGSSALR